VQTGSTVQWPGPLTNGFFLISTRKWKIGLLPYGNLLSNRVGVACKYVHGTVQCTGVLYFISESSEFMGKIFQAAQLTHERFLTIDNSCKIFCFEG
jgi:hypothetical protein